MTAWGSPHGTWDQKYINIGKQVHPYLVPTTRLLWQIGATWGVAGRHLQKLSLLELFPDKRGLRLRGAVTSLTKSEFSGWTRREKLI